MSAMIIKCPKNVTIIRFIEHVDVAAMIVGSIWFDNLCQ